MGQVELAVALGVSVQLVPAVGRELAGRPGLEQLSSRSWRSSWLHPSRGCWSWLSTLVLMLGPALVALGVQLRSRREGGWWSRPQLWRSAPRLQLPRGRVWCRAVRRAQELAQELPLALTGAGAGAGAVAFS